MTGERASVLVVGGGLAGIATACELLDRGFGVTLVERRPFLGGRTYSVLDRHTNVEVDNGQHVFMRCCTEYIRLLRRLGVYHRTHLQKRLRVLVGGPGGVMAALESSPLPPPFHLLPSLLRFPFLTARDKARAIYGLAAIRRTNAQQRRALDGVSFYQWLVEHHQTERAIYSFWNLVTTPTLNDDVRRVSADLALMVFQEGLLRGRANADIGYARVGLSRLLAQAAADYIEARGGRLLLGQAVARIVCEGGAATGLALANGELLSADTYVSAVPHQVLPSLLPDEVRRAPFFARVEELGSSPIVNVHLWYDRPVADFDFAAFLHSDAQWVFNKGAILGLEKEGGRRSKEEGLPPSPFPLPPSRRTLEGAGYLDVSLSGAHHYLETSSGEIVRRVVAALAEVLPAARGAQVVRHLVIKQREATFDAAPGCGRLRPPSRTPLANLFLAGDWTDTGWPATMEGAVRSGVACARAIDEALAPTRSTQAALALNLA